MMTTTSAVLFQWNSETNVRVDSRPTPSAYPSFVFSSSFTSRAASSSVSGSTPDSERSYLTLCSQTDCMRSISKAGNFIDAPRYPHVSCGGSDIAARRDTRRTTRSSLFRRRSNSDATKSGRMGVNVELKCEFSETAAYETGSRVGAHLAKRGDPDIYVSSFWWTALDAVREAAPSVRRAYLFASSPPLAGLIHESRRTALWALHPNRAF